MEVARCNYFVNMPEAYPFDCLKCKQKSTVDYPVCLKCLGKEPKTAIDDSRCNQFQKYPDLSCHNKDIYKPNDFIEGKRQTAGINNNTIHYTKIYKMQKELRGFSSSGTFFYDFSNPVPPGFKVDFKVPNESDKKTHFESEEILICRMCIKDSDYHFSFNKEGVYKCCACLYECHEKSDFKTHLIRHYRFYPCCIICKEWIWERESHYSEYKCKVCKEKFQCKSQLENHSLKYETKGHPNVYCRVCNRQIGSHISTENEREMYKCCECEFEAFRKYKLLSHLADHTNLRLFKCDVCYKRYKIKENLKDHSCDRKCKICFLQFRTIAFLAAHYSEVRMHR